MEMPRNDAGEQQVYVEWLRDMIENAPLVVDTSNAFDVDLDDAEILEEMRRANPEAAKYSNWPIKKEAE